MSETKIIQTLDQRKQDALVRLRTDGFKVDNALPDRNIAVLKEQGRVDDNNRLKPSRPEAGSRSHGETTKGSLGRLAAATALTLAGGALLIHEAHADSGYEGPTVEVTTEGSLWDDVRAEAIKSGLDPDADIREWVDHAVELNDGSSQVHPNEIVTIPNIPDVVQP